MADFIDKTMWQEVLTGLILAGAVYYLSRRFFFAPKKAGCAKCGPDEILKTSKKKA